MVNITHELQETVMSNDHIKTVYFDKTGRHYFNTFMLPSSKEDKSEPKQYGQGQFSHYQVIPGHNPDKVKEPVSIGVASSLIVEEVSKEDILEHEVKVAGDDVFSKLMAMPEHEKEAMRAFFASQETKNPAKPESKIAPTPAPTKDNK